MDILQRIKRLLLRGQYRFTLKAATELEMDGLLRSDAIEAIINRDRNSQVAEVHSQ